MESGETRNPWLQLLVPAFAAYILLWVAIFNGYPLVFPDNGEYLVDSFTLQVPLYRTVFYPLFIRCTSLGITPWLAVLAQSAIAVFVIYHFVKFILGHHVRSSWNTRIFPLVVVCLALATTLPWSVGELMPDVFTGLLIISMFLLLYDPQLTAGTSFTLALVIAVAVACHLSHLLISGIILLAVGVLSAFRRTRGFRPVRSRALILFVLTPILASSFAIASSNWHAGFGLTLSPGGRMIVLARLFASGLAGNYLRQDCRTEQLSACKYLDHLPTDETEFLWQGNPLFSAMGGWVRSKPEATRIIWGTIRYSPGRFFWECLKQAARQFVSMRPGDQNGPYAAFLVGNFQRFYPGDVHKIEVSKQWTGGLQKLAHCISDLDIVVFWCSLGGCMFFFMWRLGRADAASKLLVLVLIALASNALVTGSLSDLANRYQSRVSWLMPFCFMAYVLPVLWRLRGGSGREDHLPGPGVWSFQTWTARTDSPDTPSRIAG